MTLWEISPELVWKDHPAKASPEAFLGVIIMSRYGRDPGKLCDAADNCENRSLETVSFEASYVFSGKVAQYRIVLLCTISAISGKWPTSQ